MPLTPEQMMVATDWWDKFLDTTNEFRLTKDKGEDAIADEACKMAQEQQAPIPYRQRQAFRHALSIALLDVKRNRYMLHVDYDPCPVLADALMAAEINGTVFPFKTTMWFRDRGIEVRCGYGAPVEVLLAKPEPFVFADKVRKYISNFTDKIYDELDNTQFDTNRLVLEAKLDTCSKIYNILWDCLKEYES